MILMVFVGCGSHPTLSSEDLKTYVSDASHGLKQAIMASNGMHIEIVYRPKDLVLQQEAGADVHAWKEAENRLDSLDYFVLRLSHDDQEIENRYAGNEDLFNAAVQHLSSIEGDIMLRSSSKLAPQSALYVRSFGASDATSILLVFRSHLKSHDGTFSIVFDDSFFGTGRSEFWFESTDIKNVPRLKM